MTEAIGPGSAVVRIDHTDGVPAGTVAFILDIVSVDAWCDRCGDNNRVGYHLSLPVPPDIPPWHIALGWCPNHWAPYHGPEQARRIVCEEVRV